MSDSILKPGAQSDTGRITRLALRHAADAFVSQELLDRQWQDLNYTACPDFRQAIDEYDRFLEALRSTDAEILMLPSGEGLTIDSVYVRDSLVTTSRGVILCNMGKPDRTAEPEAAAGYLEQQGVPILGRITGDGRLEGGDLVWLDERTIAVGLGYRTNREGIRQLAELTADLVDDIVTVPLPHWNGPGDVMHLMSNISPIDPDLAVVYSRLLTVPFRDYLLERGLHLVEVPDEEYETMACNVLALGPRRCLMLDGNPETRRRLETSGVEVLTYKGDEISRKGAGGPTCLTRPLLRETWENEKP